MIDGHCHLDKRIGSCAEAMERLYFEACEAGMQSVILLNIPEIAFDNYEVLENTQKYANFFRFFPSFSPVDIKANAELEKLKDMGVSGLKLHPRIHGYYAGCAESIHLMKKAGELGLPVLVDCFPDGRNIALGNMPEAFAMIGEQAPETRIAIGHAGGHRILDALMVEKFYKNIYLDISFTLLYYRNSSVIQDIAYAIKSSHAKRIFWGTDYPDRPYKISVDLSRCELENMGVSEEERTALFYTNAKTFLGDIKSN